jgi:transcriptional regulator with XRE-family HTH domain
MADLIQRKELADFLRSRRERTDPVSVGLQPGPRRRTPGLRREELAQLSGVSLTWYTWLEQARDIGVSRQVFEGLARVLRMTPAERAHLFALAALALPAENPNPQPVNGTLRRLVDALDPNPSYVINTWWDLLAYNRTYAAMLDGLDERPPADRNIIWLTFTEPRMQKLLVDWLDQARQLVGQLRAHLALYPLDPRGPELLETLRRASPKFSELWDEHMVRGFQASRKRFRFPEGGELTLDYIKLAAADDHQQHLVVLLPASETDAAALVRAIRATA